MYAGGDPHSRAALDQLSAAHAQQAAASHMNHQAAAAAAAMHNRYVAAAASAAGTNHTGNHVMSGSGQVPDVHKRDKDLSSKRRNSQKSPSLLDRPISNP